MFFYIYIAHRLHTPSATLALNMPARCNLNGENRHPYGLLDTKRKKTKEAHFREPLFPF